MFLVNRPVRFGDMRAGIFLKKFDWDKNLRLLCICDKENPYHGQHVSKSGKIYVMYTRNSLAKYMEEKDEKEIIKVYGFSFDFGDGIDIITG